MSHLFTHIVARMCLGFDLYSHIPRISIGLSNLHYLWMNYMAFKSILCLSIKFTAQFGENEFTVIS